VVVVVVVVVVVAVLVTIVSRRLNRGELPRSSPVG